MSNIAKGIFYRTVGQTTNIQSVVRSREWEAVYLIETCKRVQALIYNLLEQKPTTPDELLMVCRSIILDIIGIVDFLKHLNVKYTEGLDSYNSMYLKDKTVEGLFRVIRKGFAHTTVGDGLLHVSCKIRGDFAVPYYFLQGQDALFEYKFKINDFSPKNDLCFGCGYHRISLMNHLVPYLKFSWGELDKYNKPFQGNIKTMGINIEDLSKP